MYFKKTKITRLLSKTEYPIHLTRIFQQVIKQSIDDV